MPAKWSFVAAVAFLALHAGSASAEDASDPELETFANLHVSLSGEASTGQGGGALGFRGTFSYDVLQGHGDVRPALGVSATLGGSNREVGMASGGTWDAGGGVVASLRFSKDGIPIGRRVFVSASLLRDHSSMTSGLGERVAIGGNWIASVADYVQDHRGTLVWILPHQIEGFYQRELGDSRVGLALGYGI